MVKEICYFGKCSVILTKKKTQPARDVLAMSLESLLNVSLKRHSGINKKLGLK